MVAGCVACSEMILGKRTLSVSVEDSARFGAEQREAADGRKCVGCICLYGFPGAKEGGCCDILTGILCRTGCSGRTYGRNPVADLETMTGCDAWIRARSKDS